MIPALFGLMLLGHFSQASFLNSNTLKQIGDNSKLGDKSGLDTNASVGGTVEIVIEAFLSLLGIIFVILIVYAGFSWMTANGDEAKVTKAKDTIQRAVIGLVIIVSAYAITYFVFNNLLTSPNNTDLQAGPIQ